MNSSSRSPLRFAYLLGLSFLASCALLLSACTEEGHSPDCPEENYLNDDGTVDDAKFDAWRQTMEEAGCITRVGGTWTNGGASAGGQAAMGGLESMDERSGDLDR